MKASKNLLYLVLSIFCNSCLEVQLPNEECKCDSLDNHLYDDGTNRLFIPQIFTPNGDRINDAVYVQWLNLSSIVMTIHSTRNKLLFKEQLVLSEIQSKSSVDWDGIDPKSNYAYEEGEYLYTVEATFTNGVEVSLSGKVILALFCSPGFSCCTYPDQYNVKNAFHISSLDPFYGSCY